MKGPGLAKTNGKRTPAPRQRERMDGASLSQSWRELLAHADIVSEGALRSEPTGWVYYGTTSLLFTFRACSKWMTTNHYSNFLQALKTNPHLRACTLRIARCEAERRSVKPLGRLLADLVVRKSANGIRIDVDVEALSTEHLPRIRSRERRSAFQSLFATRTQIER